MKSIPFFVCVNMWLYVGRSKIVLSEESLLENGDGEPLIWTTWKVENVPKSNMGLIYFVWKIK